MTFTPSRQILSKLSSQKIISILFFFLLTVFSLNTINAQTIEENNSDINTNEITARLIICSGLSDKNVPLDNLKDINIKEGEKITFYIKWFNLSNNSYITSMDFMDVDGNYLAQSSDYKFKPKKKSHNTWNSKKFREVIFPEGLVKIRILLDNEIILEREFSIKYDFNN